MFCFMAILKACLIADIVQHFVNAKLEFDASYIYQDVNRAIQYVHRSGLAHRGILSDPHRYLVKNVCFIQKSYVGTIASSHHIVWCTLSLFLNYFKMLVWVNISGSAITFSEDAEGKGEKGFFAHQLSILLCEWWDAVSVGGNFFYFHRKQRNLSETRKSKIRIPNWR